MKKSMLVIFGTALFIFATWVRAAEFLYPTGSNGSVALPESHPARNLYAAGATVSVKGPVRGDLVVAGGVVEITGQVEHSLLAAGGTVQVKKPVGGNVRIAGGNTQVDGLVGNDLIAAAGQFNLSALGVVKGVCSWREGKSH